MCSAAKITARQNVVEFGPGTGIITESIVRHLSPSAEFFALEVNEIFAYQTRDRCPGTTVYVANATDLQQFISKHEWKGRDAIISSLPWTLIKAAEQDQLLDTIEQSLNTGGVYVTYLYTLSPNSRAFVKKFTQRFGKQYHREALFPHMPPTNIYVCQT